MQMYISFKPIVIQGHLRVARRARTTSEYQQCTDTNNAYASLIAYVCIRVSARACARNTGSFRDLFHSLRVRQDQQEYQDPLDHKYASIAQHCGRTADFFVCACLFEGPPRSRRKNWTAWSQRTTGTALEVVASVILASQIAT